MAKVVSVTPAGIADVYNMEVDDVHNFSVNGGLIVHNCDALRYWCGAWRSTPKAPVKPEPYNWITNRKPAQNSNGFDVPEEYLLGGY